MRLYEILKEKAEIHWWKSRYSRNIKEPIYKNPSNRELNMIINKSKIKEVRIGEDDDGNIWIWDAYVMAHHDVADELLIDQFGFTMTLKNRRYHVWSDITADRTKFNKLNNNKNFKQITLGKAVYDPNFLNLNRMDEI